MSFQIVKNLVLIYVPRVHSKIARWQHHGDQHRHQQHYSPHPAEYNEDVRYEHQEISPPQLSPSPLPLPPPPPPLCHRRPPSPASSPRTRYMDDFWMSHSALVTHRSAVEFG